MDHFQYQQKTLSPFLTHSEQLYFIQYLFNGTLLCHKQHIEGLLCAGHNPR